MEILIGLLALLFATVIMVAVGDRTGLPWPVLLTLVAAGGIFLPWLPEVAIPEEMILPIFIPPLLWALARHSSWASIKRQWRTVVLLSVLLVIVTAVTVGLVAYLLVPTLSFAAAVVIGAAISPPDPVAVDAVAEPAGVPRRLSNTLQVEGLFNDAASIVVFNLALSVVQSGHDITWWSALSTLVYSAAVAVVIGFVLGTGCAKLHSWMTSSVARNAFTWVIPFATFIAAEELHASGVIAIVIAAIQFNSKSQAGAEDRLSGSAFWQVVELLFTGVAFGLIGISVRDAIHSAGANLWHGVWFGLVLALTAIAVRALWLYLLYVGNKKAGRRTGAPLRLQEVLLLTWGGMRGLVTLALVLSIPMTTGFAIYRELSIVTLTVLLVTMVIPGLTLPALMRVLNLEEGPDAFGDYAREKLFVRARFAARQVLDSYSHDIPEEFMASLRRRFEHDINADEDDDDAMTPEERRKIQERRFALFNKVRLEALYASQAELLRARSERDVDPMIVDEVLFEIDSQIIAAEKSTR
ncbi:cation:proton antiporter [Corynebacterium diphtheriae]